MESNKTSGGIKFLIVLLILIIIGLGGFIVYDKFIKEPVKCPKCTKCEVKKDTKTTNEDLYSLGDKVTLSKLSSVTVIEEEDFSNWYVLSDDGEYVTLLLDREYSKVGSENTASRQYEKVKTLFIENGIDFGTNGEVRALNKDELKLVGIDLDTKDCSKALSWVKDTITDSIDGQYYIYHSTDKSIETADLKAALYYYVPVIKILKTNIK